MDPYQKVGADSTAPAPDLDSDFSRRLTSAPAEVKRERPEQKVGADETAKDAALDAPSLPCRPGCAACCIAPSISSLAKPAGEPCRHLTADLRCALFGLPERPACCGGLQPSAEMCGENREQALAWLTVLEAATR